VHVAVFGAGALGGVYGVRLAKRAGVTVSFVVRPRRAGSREPIHIEHVDRPKDGRETLSAPERVATVPEDADVIVLAVGTEDLDAIRPVLDGSGAPIVVLTPMMPREWQRMRAAFGERVLAAMPSVVAYANEGGIIRYWLPPAPTRIDEPRAGGHGVVVRELAHALSRAGIRTHLELGVHETNPATTVCFIPVGMGVGLAGGLEALAADEELADLVRRACREGVALAPRIGRPEPLAPLAPLAASHFVLRVVVTYLRRRAPEALHYVDEHFGRKLRAQHRAMAEAMVELAEQKRAPHEAIGELAARLRAAEKS